MSWGVRAERVSEHGLHRLYPGTSGRNPAASSTRGKPQTRSSKANSSIVRRLTHLSHWFAPPIPRFGAPAGVGDDRRRSANGIGSASGQSLGGRNRHWLFALSGDVGRQYELKYRAAFGAGRGRLRGTSSFPPSLYRLVDEFYQRFTFEGFAEEAQGTSLHEARPQSLLVKSGHEDDRDVAALRQQRFLQFDAVQARHLQIGDHAGRMVQMRRLQELFCGCKRVGAEAERRHKAFHRTAHRLIIVDDRYDRGVLQLLVLDTGAQPGESPAGENPCTQQRYVTAATARIISRY